MGRNLKPAAEAGSVKVRGFCVRKCNASIWAESPMLQNLAPDDIPELYCDEETWKQLEVVHQGGPFPTDLMDIYKLLTLTVQLQLKGLTRLGLKKLLSTPDYWRVSYPEYISDEVVLLTFREPLNRLFRTEAVCQAQASEILYLARGPRMEPSVTNELNSTTAKFEDLQLERAALYFREPSVPIMIMKQEGKLKTALCYRKSCKPFELFGKYSDLQSTVDIDAFHLKYASYLLYKSGEKVYFKNLKCKVEAVPYLDNCKFLISKKDNVLVVTEEKGQYHVRIWIENEEFGGSFAYIFSATEEIKSVDIESDEVFLILKEDGSLSVAERGNTGIAISDLGKGYRPGRLNEGMKNVDVESDEDFLILNEDGSPSAAERGKTGIAISDLGKGYRSASFHDGALYALHLKEGQSDDFEMHRFKRASAAQWEQDTEFKDQGSLKEFAKGGRITFIGGEIFRISGNGLELFSTSGSPTKVLSSEEYVALSELHLHP